MSNNEIEDLIANIEQKLDDEFGVESSPSITQIPDDKHSRIHDALQYNPESFQTTPVGVSDTNIPVPSQIQEMQYQEGGVRQDRRKLDYGEQQDKEEPEAKQEEDSMQEEREAKDEEDEEDDEENGENKYLDLSNKLETALKKISSSKKSFPTLQSHSSITTDYLTRFSEYEKKKQRQLQSKRQLQHQKKYQFFQHRITYLKQKPQINKKSQQIATQTSYKPIYERFDKILEEKKKKIQINLENKKAMEEQQYQKFMDQFKSHCKLQPDACRNTDVYFHDMIAWKAKIDKEREEKVKQREIKEKQGYTFKPEINKKSQKILKNQKRIPIQDRQIERPKIQQPEFTFKPKINKRKP